MKTEYQRALDYLYSYTDYSKQSGYEYSSDRFDLQRVEELWLRQVRQTSCRPPLSPGARC